MQSMALTTDTNKLEAFGDILMAGEPADKWWKVRKVTTTLITQWADVQTAFVAKFDVLQAAEKTKQEWEQELSKLPISLEELGTRTMVGGVETHAHVAFARKMLRIAKEVGVKKSGSNIWAARDYLLISLRDQTPRKATSWEVFAMTIEKVDVNKLGEDLDKERENNKLKAELISLRSRTTPRALVPLSPTALLRTQMAHTNISASMRIPPPTFKCKTNPRKLSNHQSCSPRKQKPRSLEWSRR
ncbi:unnamed protein product [Mycena citricolor]|uniref:Uncharacterized protein n=1 Tax=Mycena citricolor TaxID=2018698 RepID=A0AAD2H050_9AGAR|nr:unnamed protein product [Mycena citricolor]